MYLYKEETVNSIMKELNKRQTGLYMGCLTSIFLSVLWISNII